MSRTTTELKLDGKTYVILPKAEYLRLRRGDTPPNTVNAIAYADVSIGRALKAAREHAGVTQEDLATKLKKSQTMVSGAEAGRVSVGERYVSSRPQGVRIAKGLEAGSAHAARRTRVVPFDAVDGVT